MSEVIKKNIVNNCERGEKHTHHTYIETYSYEGIEHEFLYTKLWLYEFKDLHQMPI